VRRDLNASSNRVLPPSPGQRGVQENVARLTRGCFLKVRLVSPAELGNWFTVETVVEPGLCRVRFDGRPDQACLVPVDPAFADPQRAAEIIRFINESCVAGVLNETA
jgi:hypothetical protein